MGKISAIEWTDHTFNPWWGCHHVSAACDHCYAKRTAQWRRKKGGPIVWGKDAPRRFLGENYWNQPRRWDREAATDRIQRKVFCASMADVFEDRRDLDPWREKLWALIEATPHLVWMLLTKRPQNIMKMVPPRWATAWPDNVWVGTTVENKICARKRIPQLLRVPARVRFLSCEPLLEDLGQLELSGIGLVIGGGESGPHNPDRLISNGFGRSAISVSPPGCRSS
jgi:protein gp37